MIRRPLLAAFLIALLPAITSAQTVQCWFGPKSAKNPDGIYHNLIRFFDSAEESIYGSVHEMDMISVAKKLAEKAEQGLDVQLTMESRWWQEHKNSVARMVLEKSKVQVHLDTKKSGLQHNKFFIVDKKRAWTGSVNMTSTGLCYNPNSGVWIENPQVAANYFTEFDEQRSGKYGKRDSGKPNTPNPVVAIPEGSIETYFGPEDDPIQPCVKLIDSAKKSVDILCFVFSSEDITKAVIRAHQRGCQVRVLLDNMFSSDAMLSRWKYVPYRELVAAGVAVKYDDQRSKLHHKSVIVDGQAVQVGSMNLSANGAKTNDENIVIIKVPAIGQRYTEEFERLWNEYPGEPGEEVEVDEADKDS